MVVAAGSGVRLGADMPKAFVQLGGEAMLVHAVRAFRGLVGAVVLVVDGALVGEANRLLRAAGLAGPVVCAGGALRQDSVRRGLEACPVGTQTVAVHDAARPLVDAPVIRRVLETVGDGWDAVAPALPIVDTLKLADPDQMVVEKTVDRRGLWAVQTPQAFPLRVLVDAHERVTGSVTDDLGAVEQAGGRVRLVYGSRRNLKVTHPEDLAFAAALLRMGPA